MVRRAGRVLDNVQNIVAHGCRRDAFYRHGMVAVSLAGKLE